MDSRLIYVVDDEIRIRELIKSYLENEGYRVVTFGNGEEALDSFRSNPSQMLIIDIMMPKMNGYDLCREVRKISKIPIIMVSAKDDEIDRILGLELGSDDYISKPFSPRELVVRVRNIFRRIEDKTSIDPIENKRVNICDITILFDERRVLKDDIEVKLTSKEYELFLYLVQNKNKVFNREQLITNVWGYDYIGDTRTIDDLVKRIRKKLQDMNSKIQITTVWGYGYKISENI